MCQPRERCRPTEAALLRLAGAPPLDTRPAVADSHHATELAATAGVGVACRAPWARLLVTGIKTLEVRPTTCLKRQRILVAQSASGGLIVGSVEVMGSSIVESDAQWRRLSSLHCVALEERPFGSRTHVWSLANPIAFSAPLHYSHTATGSWFHFEPPPP